MDFLIEQRVKGVHKFFTTREIKQGLEKQGKSSHSVYAKIRGLYDYGFIEVEMINLTLPKWRVKRKYVRKS